MRVKLGGSLSWLPLLTLVATRALSAVGAPAHLGEAYVNVPLQFEANGGQSDKAVRFLAHGPAYGLYLTSEEAVLVLAKPSSEGSNDPGNAVALRMSVVDARANPRIDGVDKLPGKTSYFIGSDPSQWHTNVPTYAKVRYTAVYPGIDLVYYGQQRQLEYDFLVAAGADPHEIVLGFEGAEALEIDAQGDLVLHTAAGDVRQHKPVVYQEIGGVRRDVDGGYVRKSATRVGFEVAEYDRSRPLVIDPVLSYSTYLGGSATETTSAIAVDTEGNAYVTGLTFSDDFPTTAGALQVPPTGFERVFVSKLNSTGSALVYSAIFAGGGGSTGIAVDSKHDVYVTGYASDSRFPTTPGAFQTTFGPCSTNAFVTKLDASGSTPLYSTFLGGNFGSTGTRSIAVDATGSAYVVGSTSSATFPTTAGAFQRSLRERSSAFVAKLNPAGSALVYSTLLGGADSLRFSDGEGIAVDAAGQAYVVGYTDSPDFPTTQGALQQTRRGDSDAFVTKVNDSGSGLVYSTYIGGSAADDAAAYSSGIGIALDASRRAYVTGRTNATDFPVTLGAFQTRPAGNFVTALDPSGSAVVYSTYLGGSGYDESNAIAVDGDGNAFVTGETNSTDFPVTADACACTLNGFGDAFVTMFSPSGSVVYSTYLGGSGADVAYSIAVDTGGNAYIAGRTTTTDDFPITSHAFQPQHGAGLDSAGGALDDGFVVKIAEPVLPIMPTTTGPARNTAASAVADSGSSAGSGGGGSIDWLTLPALLAAALARRRRERVR
jgi:hypothetical protein